MSLEETAIAFSAMGLLAAEAIILFMIYRRRKLRRSRGGDSPSARAIKDVTELAGEVEQLAARMNRQLDQRISRLKTLISDADARIERLGGIRAAQQAAQQESPGTFIAQRNPRHDQISQLNSHGLDSNEIARRMDMNIGEVELILNLLSSPKEAGKTPLG